MSQQGGVIVGSGQKNTVVFKEKNNQANVIKSCYKQG